MTRVPKGRHKTPTQRARISRETDSFRSLFSPCLSFPVPNFAANRKAHEGCFSSSHTRSLAPDFSFVYGPTKAGPDTKAGRSRGSEDPLPQTMQ
jgi:hypothetical protein